MTVIPENKLQRPVSVDTLFDGQLTCLQYKQGYRFSIDSILVSHFVRPKNGDRVLDLGSGCGVIGLILMYRYGQTIHSVTGYEKQKDLIDLAYLNIEKNNYSETFELQKGDIGNIKQKFDPETFSTVVSNPPYFSYSSGRLSKHGEVLTARHQGNTTLGDFVQGASYCVENRGRVVMIYPAASIAELLYTMKKNAIEPKRLRFIYSYPEHTRGARLALIEGVKNGGIGVEVESPCYIFQYKGGPYTEQIQNMFDS